MENSPLAAVIITISVSVIAWLCLTTIQHKQKIAVMTTNQVNINTNLNSLIDEIGKLNRKLDFFLKSELDALKDLSKNTTDTLKGIVDHKK